MSTHTTLTIVHDDNVNIKQTAKRNHIVPPYSCIGRKTMTKGTMQGYPLMDVIFECNKEELWFCKLLWNNLDYLTNRVNLTDVEFTRTDLNKISKAYTSLSKKGLVKRIQKSMYMFNPDAVLFPDNYPETKLLWDSLQ